MRYLAASEGLSAFFVTPYRFWVVGQSQTLKMTPAMAAGVSKRLWEIKDVVDMMEAWEATQ
jgi:hypothetical protein